LISQTNGRVPLASACIKRVSYFVASIDRNALPVATTGSFSAQGLVSGVVSSTHFHAPGVTAESPTHASATVPASARARSSRSSALSRLTRPAFIALLAARASANVFGAQWTVLPVFAVAPV